MKVSSEYMSEISFSKRKHKWQDIEEKRKSGGEFYGRVLRRHEYNAEMPP